MNDIPAQRRLRPRIRIVSPALAQANNGNWHTAARWQAFIAPLADATITLTWPGDDAGAGKGEGAAISASADALIALHARRSAGAVIRFRAAHPNRPIAIVLTGTDLYRDLQQVGEGSQGSENSDSGKGNEARHALQCASHLIVLQSDGLAHLAAHLPAAAAADALAKARVIVQSAPRLLRPAGAAQRVAFVAVGHLRDEKDPLTLMHAARLLAAVAPAGTASATQAPGIVHLGAALDPTLGLAAEATQQACPNYRWLGARPQAVARRWISRAGALVHPSRMEGGANVVIEALRSAVPVLASRIGGNVGLLGEAYDGYFPVGDTAALARLMQRFITDTAFADHLRAQCAAREPLFTPAAEGAAVRALLSDMLGDMPGGSPATNAAG